MKKLLIIMALMFLMGAGAVEAQNSVIDNIMTRTSIRKFKPQAVEDAKIETMLRAAMAAPTAVNKQPWHFVVVTDKKVLDELAGKGRGGDMLRNAPLAIVVCGNLEKALDGDAEEFWVQDVSAATENLLLAATALDLGAVWLSCYPNEKSVERIKAYLGLPETVCPLAIVPVGYPAENPEPKQKWDPDKIHYNRW